MYIEQQWIGKRILLTNHRLYRTIFQIIEMQLRVIRQKANLRPLVLEGQVVVDQSFQGFGELVDDARLDGVLGHIDHEEVGGRNRGADHVVLLLFME